MNIFLLRAETRLSTRPWWNRNPAQQNGPSAGDELEPSVSGGNAPRRPGAPPTAARLAGRSEIASPNAAGAQSPAVTPGDRKYPSSDAMPHAIRRIGAVSVHKVTLALLLRRSIASPSITPNVMRRFPRAPPLNSATHPFRSAASPAKPRSIANDGLLPCRCN